ncbi:hypothetical protein ACFWEB_03200 [Streptomyces parvus]|uniref:hypothetical protein n=1 Tax=Streptomyces parvus TaxID=66428 RepID=UPI00366473C3
MSWAAVRSTDPLSSSTDDGVFWIEDGAGTDPFKAAVVRADADGTNRTTVVPESDEGSLYAYQLTDSDDAVNVTSLPAATSWANETLPKLSQVAPDGQGGAQRVSCYRGHQVYASATRASASCGWTARPATRTS